MEVISLLNTHNELELSPGKGLGPPVLMKQTSSPQHSSCMLYGAHTILLFHHNGITTLLLHTGNVFILLL